MLVSSCATFNDSANDGTIVLYGFDEPDWVQVKLNRRLLFEGYLSYKPSLGVSAYIPFKCEEANAVLEIFAVTHREGRYKEKEETLTYELDFEKGDVVQITRDEGTGTSIRQLEQMPYFL